MSSSDSSRDVYTETLAVFDQRDDSCEPLTTPEVADSLNTARRTVYKRLEKLVNRGDLKTKKVGANARVWWQAEETLRESEKQLDAFVRATSDVIYRMSPDWTEMYHLKGREFIPDTDDPSTTWVESYIPPEEQQRVKDAIDEAIETKGSFELEHQVMQVDGTRGWTWSHAIPILDDDGEITEWFGTATDITDRVERERELQQYETIVETVDDGVYALDSDERFILVNDALCGITGYNREELLGSHPTLINSRSVNEAANRVSRQITEGAVDSGVLEFDIEHADGTPVPVESRFTHYETEDGPGARCGVVRDITERLERERTLESQRQQLSAVIEIHTIFQHVTHSVIEQSTREEIEQTLCEAFADSNYYDFAWVGRVSRNGSELSVHASSGTDGQLTSRMVPLHGEGSTGHDPIAQAVQTQSLQSPVDIFEDPAFDEWTTDRDRRDHNAHVLPITYDGRGFGVLTVYTERSVVRDVEQELLQKIGTIIGHAVMSVEQEQALLANQVIEVEYTSEALAERFMAASDGEVKISVDRTILLSDCEALHYLTLRGITPDEYRTVVDDIPSVTGVRVLLEESDLSRVEVQVDGDTISAVMATYNGRLTTTAIEAGEFRMVAELPQKVSLREVTDKLEEFYPDIELVGKETVSHQQVTNAEYRSIIEDSLTDRQRTTLESAFASGYFDWPREITAEELAELHGVHPSTVHQHLRRAEKNLVSTIFEIVD